MNHTNFLHFTLKLCWNVLCVVYETNWTYSSYYTREDPLIPPWYRKFLIFILELLFIKLDFFFSILLRDHKMIINITRLSVEYTHEITILQCIFIRLRGKLVSMLLYNLGYVFRRNVCWIWDFVPNFSVYFKADSLSWIACAFLKFQFYKQYSTF